MSTVYAEPASGAGPSPVTGAGSTTPVLELVYPDPDAAAPALTLTVYGKPVTQGSKTRTRWGMRDDNADTLKPWRNNVRGAALDAINAYDGAWERLEVPARVELGYWFDRPASHYRTGKNSHLLRPSAPAFPANRSSGDVDKLQRACFDALTDAGVWRDDSQVVDVHARKHYCTAVADLPTGGLAIPGAVIRIWPVTA